MITTQDAPRARSSSRTTALAFVADLLVVLVFVAIGRRNHAEGVTAAGVVATAWPFAAGTTVGWAAARAWRAPTSALASGVPVWVTTIAVGMVLRRVSGEGTPISFVIVASVFLGTFLVGWRAVAGWLRRRG